MGREGTVIAGLVNVGFGIVVAVAVTVGTEATIPQAAN